MAGSATVQLAWKGLSGWRRFERRVCWRTWSLWVESLRMTGSRRLLIIWGLWIRMMRLCRRSRRSKAGCKVLINEDSNVVNLHQVKDGFNMCITRRLTLCTAIVRAPVFCSSVSSWSCSSLSPDWPNLVDGLWLSLIRDSGSETRGSCYFMSSSSSWASSFISTNR